MAPLLYELKLLGRPCGAGWVGGNKESDMQLNSLDCMIFWSHALSLLHFFQKWLLCCSTILLLWSSIHFVRATQEFPFFECYLLLGQGGRCWEEVCRYGLLCIIAPLRLVRLALFSFTSEALNPIPCQADTQVSSLSEPQIQVDPSRTVKRCLKQVVQKEPWLLPQTHPTLEFRKNWIVLGCSVLPGPKSKL